MSECCKLYLVPEEVINTWKAEQREQAVDKPVHNLVSRMDADLQRVLSLDVPDYEKEKLYSQGLSKYLGMREQKKEPPPLPLITPSAGSSSSSLDPQLLLKSVPKTFRSKAEGLLEYLKADKDVEWDDKGQVSVESRKLEGSHIVDLIHDAMRHRKKAARPVGWRELSSHLHSRNAPRELVGNVEWTNTGYFTPPSSVHKRKPKAMSVKGSRRKAARDLKEELESSWLSAESP